MNKKLLLGAALFFISNVASATPTVDGTTISWPDDGWYQVQDVSTYSEVCAGGRSCTVAPGTYVVINHSTGERFSGIKVGELEGDTTVVVTGNTISWPNDGWYQVQDAVTYMEVCAGGRSCSVAPGTYVVINHSTGERFRGIKVVEVEGDSSIVVTGTTISWPDDGWYQVQDVSTYSEVCAGGRSCSVAPGTYVVINHSTGERFSGIKVGELDGDSSVVVTGTTISWPNDGWYQVQDAVTYMEVCAGGRSCSVAPGTYVVINHSTGERFRGIKVGEIEGGSSVVVSGNTISWPDDGWYQVQDATTYTEVCGGGRSCSVESGTYVVINHSTGERFNDIVVPSNPEPVDSLITLDSYEQILRELIKLINATPMADTLSTQPAITDAGITFVSASTGPVEDEVFGFGFVRDYSCDAGGSIEVHTFTEPGSRKLTFADCALQTGSFSGILKEFGIGREGSGVTATDYDVDTDDQTRTLSGSRGASFFRGGPGRNRFWRNTDFDAQSSVGILTLRSYELDATSRLSRPSNVNNSDLSVTFDVTAPWTGEQSIHVEATLQASIFPDTAFTWQTGEVVAVADDGSQLTLTPADAVQRTFNIALSGHDGVISRQWADGFEIFCAFTDIDLCGSF